MLKQLENFRKFTFILLDKAYESGDLKKYFNLNKFMEQNHKDHQISIEEANYLMLKLMKCGDVVLGEFNLFIDKYQNQIDLLVEEDKISKIIQ